MDRKWTPEQNNAINSVGGTVLVSAAAGSGKTAVLVQRIINRITDPEAPTDITKFLIVTFTKASAQEMKSRISQKLSEMILADPKNENLQKQKMLLKYAGIGTIDSFCKTLAEENFYKLGISPKINIVTENEIETLKNQALSDTLDYFYNLKSKDYKEFFDLLTNDKNDDELVNIIKSVYKFTLSLPFPEKWMDEKLKLYENISENSDISDLPWTKTIIEYAKGQIDIAANMIIEMLNISKSNAKIDKAYGMALNEDLISVSEISKHLNSGSFNKISEKLGSLSFANLKPLRGKDVAYEKDLISNQRSYVKKIIEELKDYFMFSENDVIKSLKSIHKVAVCLFEIVKQFEKNLSDLKSEKNIADFSDLSRWSLKILTTQNENGDILKSPLAEEISDRYEEIMVDEYQDINDIQDTIFKMISKNETNIFAVGDVKQSIYKFRSSKPEIFLGKKDKYKLYDKNVNSYPAKIILGKNFRSKSDIIDVINFIFKTLMSKKAGEIEYNEEEALFAGAEFPESNDPSTEIAIIDSANEESDAAAEAGYIAEKILKMIHEKYQIFENGKAREVTFGDFCILLRKFKNSANVYKQELGKYGIPVKTESNEKFLDTPEVLTILSLLKVINNPTEDIPLISAMLSPIFNFSLDEISEIRILETNLPVYFSVKKYIEIGENKELKQKALAFYETLEKYRNLSIGMCCNELIDLIYSETDYPAICMAHENGENKKANLILFSEYAKKFENQYHKGLFGFLKFIQNIKDKGEDLPSAPTPYDAYKSVKIMSIHKSKGLEFPICIVAGCASSNKKEDHAIYINSDLGIGVKLKNEDGTVKFSNIVTNALSIKNKTESISEELRILYVALTRAKQKLIMVAGTKNPQKTIQKHFSLLSGTKKEIPPQYVLKENTILDWLLMCVSKSNLRNKLCAVANLPEFISEEEYPKNLNWNVELISEPQNEDYQNHNENTKTQNEEKAATIDPQTQQLFEKIRARFEFKYPEKDLTNLPLKVSASGLTQSDEWQNYIASSKPCFISHTEASPTDRGNAMHKLMCCIDFNNTYKNGINFELERLKSGGFLDEKEINMISKKSIEKFLFGDIGKRILESPNIYREHRFSVTIPSKYLTEYSCLDNHYTVMQGAIDCAFSENNRYVIIDYKTDKISHTDELWEKYSKQLKLYKFALEQSENVKVSELILYSFHLGESYTKKY